MGAEQDSRVCLARRVLFASCMPTTNNNVSDFSKHIEISLFGGMLKIKVATTNDNKKDYETNK